MMGLERRGRAVYLDGAKREGAALDHNWPVHGIRSAYCGLRPAPALAQVLAHWCFWVLVLVFLRPRPSQRARLIRAAKKSRFPARARASESKR